MRGQRLGDAKKRATDAAKVARAKECFLEVLAKKAGYIAQACKAANISRRIYYKWVETDEAFAKAVEDVQEDLKDFAESKLHEAIGRGESWAICFFLKCRAKDRGYVERAEVTGPEGGPVTLKWIE